MDQKTRPVQTPLVCQEDRTWVWLSRRSLVVVMEEEGSVCDEGERDK